MPQPARPGNGAAGGPAGDAPPARHGLARGAGALLLAVTLALSSGCGRAVAGLWPPGPGVPARSILVSVDAWHAVISFPQAPEAGGAPAAGTPRFEEWGYAERGWYVEGRTGPGGVLRAMLWPSPGVVEVALADRPWADRTPDPPADSFAFALTEVGYQRLREHLRSTLGGLEPVVVIDTASFYPARDRYHAFHTCHQYAARALREAGLPVSPGLAFSRSSLASQLRRASRMAAEPAPSAEPARP